MAGQGLKLSLTYFNYVEEKHNTTKNEAQKALDKQNHEVNKH